jgi:hypothetical protein
VRDEALEQLPEDEIIRAASENRMRTWITRLDIGILPFDGFDLFRPYHKLHYRLYGIGNHIMP